VCIWFLPGLSPCLFLRPCLLGSLCLSSRLLNGREHKTTEHTVVRSGKLKRKPFNSNGAGHLLTIAIVAFSYPLVLSDSSNICIIFCVADVDALYDRSQRDTSQLPCPTMPNG